MPEPIFAYTLTPKAKAEYIKAFVLSEGTVRLTQKDLDTLSQPNACTLYGTQITFVKQTNG